MEKITVKIKCSTASERARRKKEQIERQLVAICDQSITRLQNSAAATQERTCGHRRMQIQVYRAS